jgi:hypothetical protein
MRLTKFDIGAEILSILTKGMYPDPRDAVREYIQNAIDAQAQNVSVTVRQSTVVVEDDGVGMAYDTLRKALRLGVSDKRPGKDVGFMGIGIYSAFHLCDTLTIFSRMADQLPVSVEMDFAGMRNLLKQQREQRLLNQIDSDSLVDLQTLLERYINLTDENALPVEEYPVEHGTRIELSGLDPILDDSINDFDKLKNYLQDVVPLHFNSEAFRFGQEIETKIRAACDTHNAHFELVNLRLSVTGRAEQLYRPYVDSDFSNNIPQAPLFREIKKGNSLVGIAWGCMNSTRDRISTKKLRGFLLKKQGFSIGTRESLARLFGSSNTFFDRYIGEIIVISPELLPNAARNGLEVSNLQTWFIAQIEKDVSRYFNSKGDEFQEENIAEELLKKLGDLLKSILTRFSPTEDNPNTLIDLLSEIDRGVVSRIIASRNGRVVRRTAKKEDFIALLKTAEGLEKEVNERLRFLISSKPTKSQRAKSNKTDTEQLSVTEQLSGYTANDIPERFESLLAVLESLGLEYTEQDRAILTTIDERFVQALASNKNHYYRLLNTFKEDVEPLII